MAYLTFCSPSDAEADSVQIAPSTGSSSPGYMAEVNGQVFLVDSTGTTVQQLSVDNLNSAIASGELTTDPSQSDNFSAYQAEDDTPGGGEGGTHVCSCSGRFSDDNPACYERSEAAWGNYCLNYLTTKTVPANVPCHSVSRDEVLSDGAYRKILLRGWTWSKNTVYVDSCV